MSQRVRSDQLLAAARQALAKVRGADLVERALAGWEGPAWVAGAGKAVGDMALGARRALGARLHEGVLVGKHGAPAEAGVTVRLAGHPLPDERGVAATVALLAWLASLDEEVPVVVLLSGGASALLAATIDGLALGELRAATERLLRSGATIAEINTVRRHVGRALGGRLALATRAPLVALALSDVIGDDPAAIASGPVSADPTTFADALAVATRHGLDAALVALLERGAGGAVEETAKPGDPRLGRVRYQILATPADLRDAAVQALAAAGCDTLVETRLVDGDVTAVADQHAARLTLLAPGQVRVAVGEPTVRVSGAGRGGRAQQLALEMARRLDGTEGAFLAMGSDGTDGPTDAAGAVVDATTWRRAIALGLDPARALADHDAHPLLATLGALIHTGPTGTNLLDLHLLSR